MKKKMNDVSANEKNMLAHSRMLEMKYLYSVHNV